MMLFSTPLQIKIFHLFDFSKTLRLFFFSSPLIDLLCLCSFFLLSLSLSFSLMSRAGELTRVAVINPERCKPKQCRQECRKSCPVNKQGKRCIEVEVASKLAYISEQLCIGCGICQKQCPFDAIDIIRLPKELDKDTTHRYGPNAFKLHRLPMPRLGQVLGICGGNGGGKTTSLMVLAGKLQPNLGQLDAPPAWSAIQAHFRGTELQTFFTRSLQTGFKAVIKPQYVDAISRTIKGKVGALIKQHDTTDTSQRICEQLNLLHLLDRDVGVLSGGELQRFAIALMCVQRATVYIVDEFTSYLDVSERLNAARVIRELATPDTFVVCVEHDLSILDLVSDHVCMFYGKPSVYGVVTAPFTAGEGINIFLSGFLPTENLRFRDHALTFKVGGGTCAARLQALTHFPLSPRKLCYRLLEQPGYLRGIQSWEKELMEQTSKSPMRLQAHACDD
jgi:ATP-binding cassette subfamily E protein 1